MQDPAFAAALRACGQDPVTLPGGLTMLRRRLFGLPVAMLPRAAPPVDLAAQLAALGLHRWPLILSPEMPCTLSPALRLRGPASRAVLPLAATADDQIGMCHPKWRNKWRRAHRQGMRIDHGAMPGTPDHPLLQADAAQRRARGYAGWPAQLTAAFAAIAPGQSHLFTAYQNGQPIAQMLFLGHGAQASYHVAHTTPQGRAAQAHTLMLMTACRVLADTGHRSIDLGPLDPRTPSLNRFKLRSGASATPTGGTWLRFHPLARGPRP